MLFDADFFKDLENYQLNMGGTEIMTTQLTDEDLVTLRLIGNSFIYIRAIASRGMCHGLNTEEKLELIADLADASHNLPEVLATGGNNSPISFLLKDAERLENIIKKVRENKIKEAIPHCYKPHKSSFLKNLTSKFFKR